MLLLLLLIAAPAAAIPVVPNFQQGVLNSSTTTKTKVTEVINSYEYRTGYQLTVTGTNVAPVGGEIAPRALTTTTNTLNGGDKRLAWLRPIRQACVEYCQSRALLFSSLKL